MVNNPKFYSFWTRRFVELPTGGEQRKFIAGAQPSQSNGIEFVSVLQCLHGKIVHMNLVVQKLDGLINTQIKNSTFLVAMAAGEVG